MPVHDENCSKDWIALERSWEVFCDFADADSNRRVQLKQAREAVRKSTLSNLEECHRLLAFWEQKIKYEFVWRIFDGDFEAFGCDITNRISESETLIPRTFFDQRVDSLSIVWEENRLTIFGKTIVGIRVSPSDRIVRQMKAETHAPSKGATAPTPLTDEDFAAAAGATSYEAIRAEAILYLYRTYSDFESIRLARRIEMMVDYVETHHQTIDTSWGFDRSSFYSTIRKLRVSGQLSSKNVQD